MGSKQVGKWQLEKHQVACLSWHEMKVEIDSLCAPEGAQLIFPSQSAPQRLFAIPQLVSDPGDRVEPYARGRDLIASYPSSDQREVAVELYWRWAEFPDQATIQRPNTDHSTSATGQVFEAVGTLELIYSLQTDLLDTRPDPHVQSSLIGNACQLYDCDGEGQLVAVSDRNQFPASDAAIGCLIAQNNRSALLVAMPSDLKRLMVSCQTLEQTNVADDEFNRYAIEFRLDSEFLEKGVIRRMRMFAGWGTGDCEAALLAAANQFLSSDIPLTA